MKDKKEKPKRNPRLEKWLSATGRGFAEVARQTALKEGLIHEGQRLRCTLVLEREGAMIQEEVFSAGLTPQDFQFLIGVIPWNRKHRRVFEALSVQNPRSSGRDEHGKWWWRQTYQSQINTCFRLAKVPWRVMETRPDGAVVPMVSLGSIQSEKANSQPIGTVRYSPSAVFVKTP